MAECTACQGTGEGYAGTACPLCKGRGYIKENYMDEMDFEKAREHLEACEKAYTEGGTPGYFVLSHVVRPLRDRLNDGERTQELYAEIMDISL